MSQLYPVQEEHKTRALVSKEQYHRLYEQSIREPDIFWAAQSQCIDFIEPFSEVMTGDMASGNIRWFTDGKLNVSVNCLDRHLVKHKNKTALIWEADEPGQSVSMTYQELSEKVNQCAAGLASLGIKAGDKVCIYLPMIPEVVISMLACTRIGAVHTVVFAGFSPEALLSRVKDSDSRIIITADESCRGGKRYPLKENVDTALIDHTTIQQVIVVKRTGKTIPWSEGRDLWYDELVREQPIVWQAASLDAEHPLFILYTSGSTGLPKGILHTTAGYLLHATLSFSHIFDYHADDIFWCTADCGWVTGHSYLVYGPLANAATILMYEGTPVYPTPERIWQIIDQYHVNIFYTAPTLLRGLMALGDQYLNKSDRGSLKILGSVGEPINPAAWEWYYQTVGLAKCPIVDTWWQTETGGIMLSPLPGVADLKPGFAAMPFYGVQPVLLDDAGQEIEGAGEGYLAFKQPWPGMMRDIINDHQRYLADYFEIHPGYYTCGDAAIRDTDGDFQIIGRIDDVANVSGHRIGSAEVENALVSHAEVAEAAVVAVPHKITGQALVAFVHLYNTETINVHVTQDILSKHVQDLMGKFVKLARIQFVNDLPKTRSGKIMRRILRKIANHDEKNIGDITTLSNPEIVQQIIENYPGVVVS